MAHLKHVIHHVYPNRSDSGNGVARYGEHLDDVMGALYSQDASSAPLWHIELGYTGVNEFWLAVQRARTRQAYILTLHDPPTIIGKPFSRFFAGNSFLTKLLRKSCDITLGRLLTKFIVRRAKALIILNHHALKILPRKKTYYLPLPSLLKTSDSQVSAHTQCTVLFFGNISVRKGLDILLQALIQVPHPDALRLIVAGQQDNDVRYQNQLLELQDESLVSVEMLGYVEEKQLSQLVRGADIVVLPYRETKIVHASGPLIGAMSQTRAVIVSDIETFNDVVTHKQNGLLFEEGNAADLAKALGTLVEDPQLRRQLGISARDTIRKYHSDTAIRESLTKIYEEQI